MKIAFFDADGVIVAKREKFFSQRLSEDYGIAPELVIPLFKNEFYKCAMGEMDLKEVLKSYMVTWKWSGTVDELLAYWWGGENKLNADVLKVVDELRAKGIKCYLATDQEKYRAQYMMEELGLKNHLDGTFFSCDMKMSKSTKAYWEKALQTLGITDVSDVHYWDDEIENIEAAKQVGIQTHFYEGIDSLRI